MSKPKRTVIITGSTSGIGLDLARAFLEKGANVVLNSRNPDKPARVSASLEAPERVVAVAGNIAVKSTGESLVRATVERFGRVDVLVNNAGTFAPNPFLDVTEEELDGYLNGNLRGTYLTTQAVTRQMKHQRGGSIINIGTVLIDHAVGGFPASAPLVSKGGIHGLVAELAADGIRVNLVAPGVIRTPFRYRFFWRYRSDEPYRRNGRSHRGSTVPGRRRLHHRAHPARGRGFCHRACLSIPLTTIILHLKRGCELATVVVIDEVEADNWGIGRFPVEEYHERVKNGKEKQVFPGPAKKTNVRLLT